MGAGNRYPASLPLELFFGALKAHQRCSWWKLFSSSVKLCTFSAVCVSLGVTGVCCTLGGGAWTSSPEPGSPTICMRGCANFTVKAGEEKGLSDNVPAQTVRVKGRSLTCPMSTT